MNESRCNGDTTDFRKIQALEKDHPYRWWNNIKDIAGVKVHCDSLQGLANSHCAGKLDVLADAVCDFLQSVTTDFTAQSPDDIFLPLGADTPVPDSYIISVTAVANSLSRIKPNKAAARTKYPTGFYVITPPHSLFPCAQSSTAAKGKGLYHSYGNAPT